MPQADKVEDFAMRPPGSEGAAPHDASASALPSAIAALVTAAGLSLSLLVAVASLSFDLARAGRALSWLL